VGYPDSALCNIKAQQGDALFNAKPSKNVVGSVHFGGRINRLWRFSGEDGVGSRSAPFGSLLSDPFVCGIALNRDQASDSPQVVETDDLRRVFDSSHYFDNPTGKAAIPG